VHAAGDGDVGLDLVVENRGPVQPQPQLMRAAQHQVRDHFHLFQIKIRLIEAVEDNDAVGARLRQTPGEVGARGEVGAKLNRDGNADVLADSAHQVAVAVLELLRCDVGIGGNVEDVQLQRVGARLLHVLGVAYPSAGRAAVQAGDDRNVDRGLALAQQVEIA